MRAFESLFPGVAVVATGIGLVAAIFISTDFARAAEPRPATGLPLGARPIPIDPRDGQTGDARSAGPSCSCPDAREKSSRPKFAGLIAGPTSALDESDEIAALASVHLALNGVGDGQAYVWARSNGRLSGLVRPVSSFRNDDGQICRHVILLLTTGLTTKRTESTACRLPGGRWQLGG